jgi:hypothetical protein
MKQPDLCEPRPNANCGCAEHLTLAERELSAFFRTVSELFGAEQAELSAEDWLSELRTTARVPASTREWRSLTARVLTRLAERVKASSLLTELQSL